MRKYRKIWRMPDVPARPNFSWNGVFFFKFLFFCKDLAVKLKDVPAKNTLAIYVDVTSILIPCIGRIVNFAEFNVAVFFYFELVLVFSGRSFPLKLGWVLLLDQEETTGDWRLAPLCDACIGVCCGGLTRDYSQRCHPFAKIRCFLNIHGIFSIWKKVKNHLFSVEPVNGFVSLISPRNVE